MKLTIKVGTFLKIFEELQFEDHLKNKLEFVVVGGKKKTVKEIQGFKCTELGRINSDDQLKNLPGCRWNNNSLAH